MKQIRTLHVTFDSRLEPWEIAQFRGAMAHKVGLEHEWFHNHNAETGGFHQRYPLIQYKTDPRDGQPRPLLICIESGVEEAHHFFSQPDWALQIGPRHHPMRIARLDMFQTHLDTLPPGRTQRYRLHHWQALNSEHYAEYRLLSGMAHRIQYLERMLSAHLLSFARGVEWQLEDRFEAVITQLLSDKWTTYKDVKVQTFSVELQTNLRLPDFVGLGKGASTGFGVLRRQKTLSD